MSAFMGAVVRLGFLVAAGFLAARMLTVLATAADDDQKARFMTVCLAKSSKGPACECVYEASAATLSKQEFELQLATLSGDAQRQAQIKSDPTFDHKAYSEKLKPGLKRTLACVVSRK